MPSGYKKEEMTKMLEILKSIKKDFREKDLKSFYFLYGDEDYFIDEINAYIAKLFEDNLALNHKEYTKESFDLEEVIKYILNIPLIDDKKLIVFKDIPFFKTSTKNDAERIVEAFKKAKDQNVIVVLSHDSKSKDTKYKKFYGNDNLIAKFFAEHGVFVDLHKLDAETLSGQVVKRFAKSKKIIDKVEAAYIIRNCGTNLKNLYNECDKVISYVGDKEKIDRKDIDDIITKNVEDNVFNLMYLVNSNRIEAATELYGSLVEGFEDSEKMFAILSTNYMNLYVVKDYVDRSKSKFEIAKTMGLEPWRVEKFMEVCKYTTKETLATKIGMITDMKMRRFKEELSEDLLFELLYFK